MGLPRHDKLMLPTRGQPAIISEGVIDDSENGVGSADCGSGDVLEIYGVTSFDPGDGYGARDYLLLKRQMGSTANFRTHPWYRISGIAVTASLTANQPEVLDFIKCGMTTNLHINDAGAANHGQAIECSDVQPGTGEGAGVESNRVFAVAMEDSPGAPRLTRSFVFYWRG